MELVRSYAVAAMVSLYASAGAVGAETSFGPAEEVEAFLRTARVVDMEPIGVGITKPVRVTLTDGERTRRAVWKTIDTVRQGVFKGRTGGFQASFKDSYKYEIAAYELDKLLGLGLVPPTVEREIDGKTGSLQLWIEGAFTELDRREDARLPEDRVAWSNQLYKLRLLHQLTYNDDSVNLRNVLYDESFRVYAIDNSRSFRRYHALMDEEQLRRFSRSVVAGLEALDRRILDSRLGAWLTSSEIEALLARRDLLLERASLLAADYGEEKVYYP